MTKLLPITGGLISLALVVTYWGNTQITDPAIWGGLLSALFLAGGKR